MPIKSIYTSTVSVINLFYFVCCSSFQYFELDLLYKSNSTEISQA